MQHPRGFIYVIWYFWHSVSCFNATKQQVCGTGMWDCDMKGECSKQHKQRPYVLLPLNWYMGVWNSCFIPLFTLCLWFFSQTVIWCSLMSHGGSLQQPQSTNFSEVCTICWIAEQHQSQSPVFTFSVSLFHSDMLYLQGRGESQLLVVSWVAVGSGSALLCLGKGWW